MLFIVVLKSLPAIHSTLISLSIPCQKDGIRVIPLCRYIQPSNDVLSKQLSSDDHFANKIFEAECVRRWNDSVVSFRDACCAAFASSNDAKEEKSTKNLQTMNAKTFGITDEKMKAHLHRCGIGLLQNIVQEKEIQKKRHSFKEQREKEQECKASHTNFVRKKSATTSSGEANLHQEETFRNRRRSEQKSQIAYEIWRSGKEKKEQAALLMLKISRPTKKEGDISRCVVVGQALKTIDVSLYTIFVQWSKDFLDVRSCEIVWDFLEPRGEWRQHARTFL